MEGEYSAEYLVEPEHIRVCRRCRRSHFDPSRTRTKGRPRRKDAGVPSCRVLEGLSGKADNAAATVCATAGRLLVLAAF
jgi:hypothetical protein